MNGAPLQIRDLTTDGPIEYLAGLALQEEIHQKVALGISPSELILLEHQSVFTAGKRTENHERPLTGARVIDVNRGGKITWHGPGQIVGYPIIKLGNPAELLGYVRTIEAALIAVLDKFSITGRCIKGRSGVWIDGQRKIAAIGIRVAQSVTMHGFALNVNCDLSNYQEIIPCGITDGSVTSMSVELGRRIEVSELLPILKEEMTSALTPLIARNESSALDAGDASS
ncbi:MAG: lipoyl(octanoyl) transferase LipB [Actinobacteria bacterium]|nr:lipoyl(octanoyl) transferase LipB [Actinomycetota bacterium]